MIIYPQIDPVAFSIFAFDLHWYGIIYMIGFVCIYLSLPYLARRSGLSISDHILQDMVFWVIMSSLLFARLSYIIFYNLDYYLTYPLKIFAIWEGGMSFHGALIGALISGFIFIRIHSMSFLRLADIFIIPVSFSLALGRIGNFINAELVGRESDLPWAMIFPGDIVSRHPSQIYESIKNLFIFFILISLFYYFNSQKKKMKAGIIFALFLILYGVLRILVEFVRKPEIVFFDGLITMGQLLSFPMIIFGFFIIWQASVSRVK